MAAASSVEYYEKLGHLQEIQRESEQKRLILEQKLNAYVRSDQRLAKLRAARLQNYWKKIVEDEKKSQWRNEQLLKDFERVEAQMAVLNARTHKLMEMKRQYEDYIERSYPNWKEKVIAKQRMKSQPPAPAAPQNTFTLSQPGPSQPQYHQAPPVPHDPHPEYLSTTMANSTLQTVSSLQTGMSLTTTQEGLLKAYSTASAVGETLNTTGFGSLRDPHDSDPHLGDSMTSAKVTVMKGSEGQPSGELDTWRSEVSQHSASHNTATPKSMSAGRVSSQHSAASRHSERHNSTIGDDVEELGDESMPLSSRGDKHSTPRSQVASPDRQSPQRVLSREHSRESIAEERSVYPEADITLDGLYNMLTTIQEALPGMRKADELYRGMSPALSVRNDIIQNANRGAMLSHVDPSSVSMVVLEQLPLVVTNCEGACLLPDKMLFSPHASVMSENYVKSQIHPASRVFWSRMYDHMVLLIKHRAMQATDISAVFASLLIAEDSPYEEKAKSVLMSVLEEIEPDDGLASPNSTATLSSMALSPQRQPKEPTITEKSEAKSKSSEDDDFFSQPVPATNTNTNSFQMGSLTQSMAYKRMLGETGSTQKTISYEVSDEDSEDDIEKALSMGGTAKTDKPASAVSAVPAPTSPTPTPGRDEESEESSPPLSPAYVPSALDQSKSPLSTLQSTGKSAAKKKPAFMYGDSDTEEEVEIPGADATDASKHGVEEDDFEFYG